MSKQNIEFTFMHGAGNIFCVIDNRKLQLSIKELMTFIVKDIPINWLVDGLIAIRNSEEYDFEVDFLNPDGSYGAMCGNGARCAVTYFVKEIMELAPDCDDIFFLMAGKEYQASFILFGDIVDVYFKDQPTISLVELPTTPNIHGYYVENGSDHLIIDAKQILNTEYEFEHFPLNEFAKPLRHSSLFPRGANVNIVFAKPDGTLRIRTFERGVEGETAACGTGSLAAAFTYVSQSGSPYISGNTHTYPKSIIVKSGYTLTIKTLIGKPGLSLSGPAEFLTEEEAYAMFLEYKVGVS
jgi:diaminopimelate epimerase